MTSPVMTTTCLHCQCTLRSKRVPQRVCRKCRTELLAKSLKICVHPQHGSESPWGMGPRTLSISNFYTRRSTNGQYEVLSSYCKACHSAANNLNNRLRRSRPTEVEPTP